MVTKITKKALKEAKKYGKEITQELSAFHGQEITADYKVVMTKLLNDWLYNLKFYGHDCPTSTAANLLEAFISLNNIETDTDVPEGQVRIVNMEQPKFIIGLNVSAQLVTGIHSDGKQDRKYRHTIDLMYLGKQFKTDFFADERQDLESILQKIIRSVSNTPETKEGTNAN